MPYFILMEDTSFSTIYTRQTGFLCSLEITMTFHFVKPIFFFGNQKICYFDGLKLPEKT